jgi:hypothetical protein
VVPAAARRAPTRDLDDDPMTATTGRDRPVSAGPRKIRIGAEKSAQEPFFKRPISMGCLKLSQKGS